MNISHPPALAPAARSGLLAAGTVLLAAGMFLAGCASSTEVKIDSLSKPNSEAAVSYRILNKNPQVADDSLRFKEAAAYVKTALSGKGMYEATDNDHADVVVNLDYGVGPPQARREVMTEPVYLTMPGQIRTERVQTGTDRNGNAVYQTITVQDPPRTELAGYRDYTVTTIVYEKYLKLSAMENKVAAEGRPATEVWTVDVTSEGQSKDIRKNLPVLVGATIEYIGKDSHGQKTIRIKDTNSDVAFVKKGM
ncbi:MAG: DUF4136 domain-containing protein [Opitutus sp.]|nr:DUF4136 domain-containing protein [Opitutus sp.]